jgi:hypothetical protein
MCIIYCNQQLGNGPLYVGAEVLVTGTCLSLQNGACNITSACAMDGLMVALSLVTPEIWQLA